MLTFRHAQANDFNDIAEIYQYYVKNTVVTFELQTPTASDMHDDWQSHPDMPFWVAKNNSKVVGYAYVRPYHTRCAYRFTVEDTIYVSPQHLGRGIGLQLLTSLVESCRTAGFKQIIARISVSEHDPASVKLHQKLGFKQQGILNNVGYKFDRYINTLLLQKSL